MSSARGSSNRREVSTPLLVLMGMVALVLLIACANVASLMVARTEERQREIAVRTALGACGPDRMRQPGAESLLMAVLGGGAGLLVAVWTRDALLHSLPSPHRVQALATQLDLRLLAFNFAVTLLAGLISRVAPAMHAVSGRPMLAWKDESRPRALVCGRILRRARGPS